VVVPLEIAVVSAIRCGSTAGEGKLWVSRLGKAYVQLSRDQQCCSSCWFQRLGSRLEPESNILPRQTRTCPQPRFHRQQNHALCCWKVGRRRSKWIRQTGIRWRGIGRWCLASFLSLATIYGLNRYLGPIDEVPPTTGSLVIRRRIKAMLHETSLTVCQRRQNYLLFGA
jgi:hypothetical protein